jgi:predicted nucleotidyltransferase
MGNIFNQDFRDFIQQFNENQVKYILIGGYSVILHGYSRTTGDMDIWVERTTENYKKIKFAFACFGMPMFDMTEENFLHHPEWDVFTYGKPPSSIDIMTNVKGMSFEECFSKAVFFEEDGLEIRTIHINNLISAKKASGRAKDQQDIENLNP